MILAMYGASSKETIIMVTWSMELAVRSHYRAAPPTPRLRPITLSDRSCSCWIGSRRSRNLTALVLHARSDSRDSHTHRRPKKTKLTKKGHSYGPQTLSVSLVILTIEKV